MSRHFFRKCPETPRIFASSREWHSPGIASRISSLLRARALRLVINLFLDGHPPPEAIFGVWSICCSGGSPLSLRFGSPSIQASISSSNHTDLPPEIRHRGNVPCRILFQTVGYERPTRRSTSRLLINRDTKESAARRCVGVAEDSTFRTLSIYKSRFDCITNHKTPSGTLLSSTALPQRVRVMVVSVARSELPRPPGSPWPRGHKNAGRRPRRCRRPYDSGCGSSGRG